MGYLMPGWKVLVFSYFAIMLVGSMMGAILGVSNSEKRDDTPPGGQLDDPKQRHWIVRSDSAFNQIFAYGGNSVWLIYFCVLAAVRVFFTREDSRISLPIEVRTSSRIQQVQRKRYGLLAKEYGIKLLLKYFLLWFTFLLIDNLFIITGGHCSAKPGLRDSTECRALGGDWEGGFDISGHFCFLVSISMILWLEIRNIEEFIRSRELIYAVNIEVMLLFFCVFSGLFIWIMMLCITSIYYHTFFEKFLGCMMGFIPPLFMYYILPKNNLFAYWFYK